MNNAEEKKRLREELKEVRARLRNGEKDEKIAERFFDSPFFAYRSFFVYVSFRTEADTKRIISRLHAAGKRVCLPRVSGNRMVSVPVFQNETLEKGAFGVMQPKEAEEFECEVALVPLLGADETGNRLGYGGGYYDRYFASYPHTLRVGICYEGQVVPSLPAEDTDMRLDALITEKGLRYFGAEGEKRVKILSSRAE